MKVIDLYLAIERNKNIPKEVVYKYKTYKYYPKYKQFYREEYGNMISLFLEANSEEDRVYTLEDTPKEDKKIDKFKVIKDNTNNLVKLVIDKETKLTISIVEATILDKVNEIIDRLNGGEK